MHRNLCGRPNPGHFSRSEGGEYREPGEGQSHCRGPQASLQNVARPKTPARRGPIVQYRLCDSPHPQPLSQRERGEVGADADSLPVWRGDWWLWLRTRIPFPKGKGSGGDHNTISRLSSARLLPVLSAYVAWQSWSNMSCLSLRGSFCTASQARGSAKRVSAQKSLRTVVMASLKVTSAFR